MKVTVQRTGKGIKLTQLALLAGVIAGIWLVFGEGSSEDSRAGGMLLVLLCLVLSGPVVMLQWWRHG